MYNPRATEKIITNIFPNRLAEEILGSTFARWSNCQSGSLRAGCRIFRFPALSFIGRLYNQYHHYLYHSFSLKIWWLTLNLKLQIWGRLSRLPLCIKDPDEEGWDYVSNYLRLNKDKGRTGSDDIFKLFLTYTAHHLDGSLVNVVPNQ